jgi:hypothetical protein
LEEEIIFFLLQLAAPRHELRSVFTRGSIRGWVYLEATMNDDLRYLLKHTPGVGTVYQPIEFKDWVSMLTMHDSKGVPEVGKWVEVRRGIYKGDVGYIHSVEDWGVQLLLVPRLPPPALDIPHSKRKRTHSRATPALFDPAIMERVYKVEAKLIQENLYSFKGYNFEHGLIVKPYDFHSISTTVHDIPLSLFLLFRFSRHPKLLAFPKPLEWKFYQGDDILVLSNHDAWIPTRTQGVITALRPDSVEVDLTGKGIASVPWSDIRKFVCDGDFVEVTGGEYRGRSGWVNKTQYEFSSDDVVSIVELQDGEKPLSERIEVCMNIYV